MNVSRTLILLSMILIQSVGLFGFTPKKSGDDSSFSGLNKKHNLPTIRVLQGDFLFELKSDCETDNYVSCDDKSFVELHVFLISTNKMIFYNHFCTPAKMKFIDFIKSFDFDDYNFDGFPDFRFARDKDLIKHNYYLFDEGLQQYSQDFLLSAAEDFVLNKDSLTVEFYQRYAGFEIKTLMQGPNLTNVSLENWTVRSLELSYQDGFFVYLNGVLFEIDLSENKAPLYRYEFEKDNFIFLKDIGYRFLITNPAEQTIGDKAIYKVVDPNGKVIFESETSNFYTYPDTTICSEDYNFDGFTDLKIWDPEIDLFVYYFYDKALNQFIEDSLVSSFPYLTFDALAKTISYVVSDRFYIGQDISNNRTSYTMITHTLSGTALQNYEVKTEIIDFITNEKSISTKKYSYINKQLTEILE